MTELVKSILAQESAECAENIRKLVSVWMADNDVKTWNDLRYPWEFNVADPDYHFSIASGATKVVLIPEDATYVIKIPFIGEDDYEFTGGIDEYDLDAPYDYCAAEAYLYEEAVVMNCSQFLVPTAYFGEVGDIPIYIQTKINFHFSAVKPPIESVYRYASIENSEVLNAEVGAKLLEDYSLEEVTNFVDFVRENSIDDLESYRNGGYVSSYGRYVFWDYCGYKER